jgi:putative transposase
MGHTRGPPVHRMAQGRIERYNRTTTNVGELVTNFDPCTLERGIARFVGHYNHQRYHEVLNNVTPADVCFGRAKEGRPRRAAI